MRLSGWRVESLMRWLLPAGMGGARNYFESLFVRPGELDHRLPGLSVEAETVASPVLAKRMQGEWNWNL